MVHVLITVPATCAVAASTALGPPQGDLLQLLGALYGATSIIIVFQMFSLQIWYQKVHDMDDMSFEIDQRTVTGALERSIFLARIRAHRHAFPWFQLIGCGSALIALSVASYGLAARYVELPWYYTIGPVLILSLTFVGVTVATIWSGMRLANIAFERLQ